MPDLIGHLIPCNSPLQISVKWMWLTHNEIRKYADNQQIPVLENKIISTIQEKYGITLHPEVEHI